MALCEEHASVGAFLAANEEYGIMLGGEFSDVLHAVCRLAADGVVVVESGFCGYSLTDFFYDLSESVERLCGLGIQANVFIVI